MTVVLLRRENIDGYVDIDLDVEKLEGKSGIATYKEIKAYIEEKYGMSVPSGYIAQVKDKVGLEKRKNYNVGSGKGRVANCPPEKKNSCTAKGSGYCPKSTGGTPPMTAPRPISFGAGVFTQGIPMSPDPVYSPTNPIAEFNKP